MFAIYYVTSIRIDKPVSCVYNMGYGWGQLTSVHEKFTHLPKFTKNYSLACVIFFWASFWADHPVSFFCSLHFNYIFCGSVSSPLLVGFTPLKLRRSEGGPEVYLVERFICNEEVGGSTPPGSTAVADPRKREAYWCGCRKVRRHSEVCWYFSNALTSSESQIKLERSYDCAATELRIRSLEFKLCFDSNILFLIVLLINKLNFSFFTS